MVDKVANVFRTDNYSLFKNLDGNRDVMEMRVARVVESIQKNGYIMSPIIVNENYEVIDGQARLAAFKMLNMPVDYIIVRGTGIRECVALNRYSTQWAIKDYVKSYADQGNQSFIYFYQLYKAYISTSLYPLSTVYYAVTGRNRSGGKVDELQIGTFKCTQQEYEMAVRVLDSMSDIRPIINKIPSKQYLWFAIMWMMRSGYVDIEKLKKCIDIRQGDLRPPVSTEDAIDIVNDMYNYGNRKKVIGLSAIYRSEKNKTSAGLYEYSGYGKKKGETR